METCGNALKFSRLVFIESVRFFRIIDCAACRSSRSGETLFNIGFSFGNFIHTEAQDDFLCRIPINEQVCIEHLDQLLLVILVRTIEKESIHTPSENSRISRKIKMRYALIRFISGAKHAPTETVVKEAAHSFSGSNCSRYSQARAPSDTAELRS